MNKNWLAGTALATAISVAALAAFAHGGATGIVKERMDLMSDLGKGMKALKSMMSGESAYDAGQVRSLAQEIAAHGGEKITVLFPDGSGQEPSEAQPAIWQDWERFSALADRMKQYAAALEQSAGNERAPMDGGMMPGGMMPGTMMGSEPMGGKPMGSGMMGADMPMQPSPEHLAQMPPDAAFMALAGTCAACHQDFRKEKKK